MSFGSRAATSRRRETAEQRHARPRRAGASPAGCRSLRDRTPGARPRSRRLQRHHQTQGRRARATARDSRCDADARLAAGPVDEAAPREAQAEQRLGEQSRAPRRATAARLPVDDRAGGDAGAAGRQGERPPGPEQEQGDGPEPLARPPDERRQRQQRSPGRRRRPGGGRGGLRAPSRRPAGLEAGTPVLVVGKELLEHDLAAGQLLPQPLHLAGRERRRVRLRRGHVRLEELELRHAAHGGRDRQAPGVAQQRRGVRPAVHHQLVLARDLHQDDAEVLLVGGGKGQLLEARRPRRVHRHLHAVEVVAARWPSP